MPDYAVRITHSYDVASPIIRAWALKANRMAVYEHEGAQTEKVHVHMVIEGTSVDKKQLRNIAEKTGIPVKGNEYMSFKEYNGDKTYMTYMTKGQHEPKYLQNYTAEEAEQWKVAYVPPVTHDRVHPDSKFVSDYLLECGIPDNIYDLRRTGKRYVYDNCGRIWNGRAMNMYKTLMRTCIYAYNIQVPDDEPAWKW